MAVLGISKDPPDAQRKWKEKLGLPFPLLSDPDAEVQRAWGAWGEKNMYGKRVEGTRLVVFFFPKANTSG